jgi:hypothetical protein
MKLPEKTGEYLFYFGNSKPPYYALLDVEVAANGDAYISEYHKGSPTHWWHLPEPNQFPNATHEPASKQERQS